MKKEGLETLTHKYWRQRKKRGKQQVTLHRNFRSRMDWRTVARIKRILQSSSWPTDVQWSCNFTWIKRGFFANHYLAKELWSICILWNVKQKYVLSLYLQDIWNYFFKYHLFSLCCFCLNSTFLCNAFFQFQNYLCLFLLFFCILSGLKKSIKCFSF